MDIGSLAAIVTALGGPGLLLTLWKAAKAYARAAILAEQAEKTIAAKDRELERLWGLLDTLTQPGGH